MQQLDTLDAVKAWLSDPERDPAAVQALDLDEVHDDLASHAFPGCLFLGCRLPNGLAAHLVSSGATVIGHFPQRLFQVHRAALYGAHELFEGFNAADPDSFLSTLDHRIYEEYLDDGGPEPRSIAVSLARRLHDHSITDAIAELVDGRTVVAFMGGHALERADPVYESVARMARALTRSGVLVASGGGPGAMEATHVGAWFAGRPDDDMAEALRSGFVRRPKGSVPGKEYADPDWLHRAMAMRAAYPQAPGDAERYPSLGIPTWLYGHEPPAPFATHIGKYFANSVREDGLLALAKGGVVFAPGSAGTIQEIFQDLTQNHYGTLGVSSPMVLFGKDYWTNKKPVYPLLKALAEGQPWRELLHLVDTPDDALGILGAYEPLHHLSGSLDRTFEAWLRRRLSLRGNVRFEVQREVVAPTRRDLDDPDVVRETVLELLDRMQRRGGRVLTEDVAASVAMSPVVPGGLGDWLLESLGDDWVSPPAVRSVEDEMAARAAAPAVLRLPGVDVAGLGLGGVPSEGVLVLRRGRKLSVWAAGLDD